MAIPQSVNERWQKMSDLTIYDAAFWMVVGSDPTEHKLLCDSNSYLGDQYYYHPGGLEAVCEKCEDIICAVLAGNIKLTHKQQASEIQATQTDLISKSDWIIWCQQNGHSALSLSLIHISEPTRPY